MLSGLFFVFSKLPTESGIPAMQSINTTIINSGFMGLFIGTASGNLTVLVVALKHWTPGKRLGGLRRAALLDRLLPRHRRLQRSAQQQARIDKSRK